MGTTCCKSTSGDQIKTYIHSLDKKKQQVLLNRTAYPLNSEALQTLTLGVVASFIENNQLSKYSEQIRQFILEYNYSKFAPFLVNFNWFIFSENIGTDYKITPAASDFLASKSTMFMTIKENSMTHYDNSTSGFKNYSPRHTRYSKESTSVTYTDSEKLFNFFKQEIMHKDNFFFELTVFLAQIYTSQYSESLNIFTSLPISDLQLDEETKDHAGSVFLEAREDIKQFEEFLYNCLKVFLMQISIRNKGDESLVPSRKDLNDLALKLLFTPKDSCYKTYFTIIRYYTLEDEIALRNAYGRLKELRPESFAVEREFCQVNKEIPYERIIESLEYLDLYQNPQDKFQLIASIRRQILRSMDEYRKKEGLDTEQVIMTGEHLLPLFTYFFCKE